MTHSNLRSFLISALILTLVAACSIKRTEITGPPSTEVAAGILSEMPPASPAASPASQRNLPPGQGSSTPEPSRSTGVDLSESQVTLWADKAAASSNLA